MSTGLVWNEKYMWHDTGSAGLFIPAQGWIQPAAHVEHPESKRRVRNLLDATGLLNQLVPIQPRPAMREDLLRFHSPGYINQLETMNNTGGSAGDEAPFAIGGYEIALLSAGGVLQALDAIYNGEVENAYALVRPPGHHALADKGMGFCLLANIVIGIKYAQAVLDVKKVAVIDYDVHHGNGTQSAFYTDPDVLTISIHQDNCYPNNSGSITEIGEGLGKGKNINIPLPAGSGRDAYLAVFKQVVAPAVEMFQPELIIVASGFDASGFDPMGRMMLSSKAYKEMAERLKHMAQELCFGRLLFVHEGGYCQVYTPFCAHAVISELANPLAHINDPFCAMLESMQGPELYPHQEQIINTVKKQMAEHGLEP